MAIEKTEHLASVEILLPSRAIQAAWHTYITEDGVVISGPAIRRRAYVGDETAQIIPEIASVISEDYLQLLAHAESLAQQLQTAQARIAEVEQQIAELKVGGA